MMRHGEKKGVCGGVRPELKLRFCFTDGKMWCKYITSICVDWYIAVIEEHLFSLFHCRNRINKVVYECTKMRSADLASARGSLSYINQLLCFKKTQLVM